MVDQIGGNHYQSSYAHWDWVGDVNLCYLAGNATKYIIRCWNKGKVLEDLDKAISYIEKMIQRKTIPEIHENWDEINLKFFEKNNYLDDYQRSICDGLCGWSCEEELLVVLSKLKGYRLLSEQRLD